ncbi:MAG TPA: hypothetical protein VG605_24435, partial [Puia sp.]|nr:hypothetical protein [Puia sp.]
LLIACGASLTAQNVYTITADSIKLTSCDSSELIIENHTQNVPGFLFNTGRGRTIFKRGTQKLNDSMYLIGADTMTLPPSWIQGGNAFGAPGVLGTKDNQPFNLYTGGQQRATLATSGNLILGSSTDNGNRLQVNGSANIGNATITQTGNLIGTNAVLYDYFIPRFHNYRENSPFISRLDDILYNYNVRLHTTKTTEPDGSTFIDIVFPADELTSANGVAYSSGRMYFSFWPDGLPQRVSVTAINYQGTSFGPYICDTSLNNADAGLYEVDVNIPNWLTELKVTITPTPGGFANLQDIAYVLNNDAEGLVNPYPYVSKYQDEHIYNYFYLKHAGVDNVGLSPYLDKPNYFMNAIGIGTSTPTAQLHTTGSVRFAGLTQDSTKTNVLVSDADGNLYYRSASSLAADNLIRSSLAINGPITAQKLTLTGRKDWPDYVFDSAYQLKPLSEVAAYLKQEHHLPDIPAAAEIQKQGLDVGANQAALLKKIEELTLYNIDQANKLEEQNKLLETQGRQLTTLKAEVEELKAMIKQTNH